jgi:hypothetical protein
MYQANSIDGASFQLQVVEIDRRGNRSTISVPGFHQRTAAGSRWLMCIFNDLALKRGFKYWLVVYPEEPNETFPIGLYHSPQDDPLAILGDEYADDRAFPPASEPMSTDMWSQTLCAWKK